MWWFIGIVMWWLSAFLPLVWMWGGGRMTWGDLLLLSLLSLIGPVLCLIILLMVIIQLDFWKQPIFPEKK